MRRKRVCVCFSNLNILKSNGFFSNKSFWAYVLPLYSLCDLPQLLFAIRLNLPVGAKASIYAYAMNCWEILDTNWCNWRDFLKIRFVYLAKHNVLAEIIDENNYARNSTAAAKPKMKFHPSQVTIQILMFFASLQYSLCYVGSISVLIKIRIPSASPYFICRNRLSWQYAWSAFFFWFNVQKWAHTPFSVSTMEL